MSEKVTIIVIAFNEELQIERCLRALLAQDVAVPFEVTVVDDGSSDATASIVEELQRHQPMLRLIRHNENCGRGAARRTGQESADSHWIGFVDADIVVPPFWLRRCLDGLSDADGVSGIAQPDGDCAVIWRICQPAIRDRSGSAEITGNNVVFSRTALARVPFAPSSKLGEDFRLAKSMTLSGLRLRTIEDLKVSHRESKTYWKSIAWMWQSGEDATALLFEFRSIRLPDLAWIAWTAGVAAVVSLAITGHIGVLLAVVAASGLTIAVDWLFIYSRFIFRPHPLRFLFALTISPPQMLAYLLGRGAGLLRTPFHLTQMSRGGPN